MKILRLWFGMLSVSLAAHSAMAQGRLPLNELILETVQGMPRGGGYSTSSEATRLLSGSMRPSPDGGVETNPQTAQPSYCSGATYIVFLRTIDTLRKDGKLGLDSAIWKALPARGQRDGEGIWGRWNANGPGTARLFHELQLGRNFSSFDEARSGDFLKIFWTTEIGALERGHSVIFLGTEVKDGVEYVRFWSSNKPAGYGERLVPRTKIARAVFSRLEHPANLASARAIPPQDPYLASLLKARSSEREVREKCGF